MFSNKFFKNTFNFINEKICIFNSYREKNFIIEKIFLKFTFLYLNEGDKITFELGQDNFFIKIKTTYTMDFNFIRR